MKKSIFRLATFAIIALIGTGILLLSLGVIDLTSIISAEKPYLVHRIESLLGRPVTVKELRCKLGWSLLLRAQELVIGEDPSFGDTPFFRADEAVAKISLPRLLLGQISISELTFERATVRFIRSTLGTLNVKSLGTRETAAKEAREQLAWFHPVSASIGSSSEAPVNAKGTARAVYVHKLTLRKSRVEYLDQRSGVQFALVNADLTVRPVTVSAPMAFLLKAAFLSEKQNFTVIGSFGPLEADNKINVGSAPLKVSTKLDLPDVQRIIDVLKQTNYSFPQLLLQGPVTFELNAQGRGEHLDFHGRADLSALTASYAGIFHKGSQVKSLAELEGTANGDTVILKKATVTVQSLSITASDFVFGPERLRMRLRIDHFELTDLAQFFPGFADYQPHGYLQGAVNFENGPAGPIFDGLLVLSQGSFVVSQTDLNVFRNIQAQLFFDRQQIRLQGARFELGAARIDAEATTYLRKPLQADFRLQTSHLTLADLIRKEAQNARYEADNLAISGTIVPASGRREQLSIRALVRAQTGLLANLTFKDLSLVADYVPEKVLVDEMSLKTLDGQISGKGQFSVGVPKNFTLALKAHDLDLRQLGQFINPGRDFIKRGRLNGALAVAGSYDNPSTLKTSLVGSGSVDASDASFTGLNPVFKALSALQSLPGIKELVTPEVIAQHTQAFDTDLAFNSARCTFTVKGPVISSQDLQIASSDYTIRGKGLVTLDEQLDFYGQIALSSILSRQLIARNSALDVLADTSQVIHIPVHVFGTFSNVRVEPDLPGLFRTINPKALKDLGQKLLKKLFSP